MKHNKKTNAARKLDDLHLAYEIKEYPVDEEHLDAVHVANSVNMPVKQVFKTLVVRGDKTGVLFAVIPGDGELDLKALASHQRQQTCRACAFKRGFTAHRLYSWWLFTPWRQEKLSRLFGPNLRKLAPYRNQRRSKRHAINFSPQRFAICYRCNSGTADF
jgi:hypothetical protein